ncbi:MAG: hypothetical protein KIG88_05060 [Weeksellaceae bacterium]|nr:hypothetical protein [Weeksellaceae bacterium]
MIRRVKRENIDLEKYSRCLAESVNYRIYAEYWYLDTLVGNNWDCYVLNDYEAIMPLPFVKKFGIKFISQPIYCQQLGVFHSKNFTKELFLEFQKKLQINIVRYYCFNEQNVLDYEIENATKLNQILSLNFDYDSYTSTIRKNRKQEIRKGLPKQFSIVESSNDQSFIALLKEDYQEIKNNLSLDKLQLLVTEIQNRNLGKTISILEEGKVVASSFYIVSGNRLIQLCNAKRINYSINFNTFIVDFMIKKYTKKGLVLDFEGSSIKGVNEFNSSFRAENKYLKEYQNLKF